MSIVRRRFTPFKERSWNEINYHCSFYWHVNLRAQYRCAVAVDANVLTSNRAQRKTSVFFGSYDVQHENKKQNWQWTFSRFLRWNSVKFGRLVINIFNTANTNPTVFVFKIRIPPYSIQFLKNFTAEKFREITKKALETVNNASV